MNENGETPPPETLLCGRCVSAYDPEDNFCRQCGAPLHDPQLPSVRDEAGLPAVWRPPLRAVVVRGAVFVAAGTMAEMLIRRLVRGALGQRPRAPQSPFRREATPATERDETADGDAEMVSETLLLRRIRFRR